MKFSIVTPSLNQGRFLRDCIESVRTQSESTWEHLVIDGGSTDTTLAILHEYPHLQWISEPDHGMSEAINKGFRRASGDWLMWLNADDYLLPDALAKVAAFAQLHAEADVVYGRWQFVDSHKQVISTVPSLPYFRLMNIHSYPSIASTACFYRKKTTVDEGFLVQEQMRYCMDVEYYARLGSSGKRFAHLPQTLAAFRQHGENLSLKHFGARDLPGQLQLQKLFAESAAIRRSYGITVSSHEYFSGLFDALLFAGFGGAKVILRALYNLGRD